MKKKLLKSNGHIAFNKSKLYEYVESCGNVYKIYIGNTFNTEFGIRMGGVCVGSIRKFNLLKLLYIYN